MPGVKEGRSRARNPRLTVGSDLLVVFELASYLLTGSVAAATGPAAYLGLRQGL